MARRKKSQPHARPHAQSSTRQARHPKPEGNLNLSLVPLGGLGRIGGNCMVYETATDIVVVDCGMLMPDETYPGVDLLIPDFTYLQERKHKLRGYVLTHAHEDHLGALPWALDTLPAPVYGTRFTIDMLESKLREYPNIRVPRHIFADGEHFEVGGLSFEAIPVTHSIPDSVALAITTPAGVVIHTGDFKLDPSPVDKRTTDAERFKQLGKEGVALLLSDSTNAQQMGASLSEEPVRASLLEVVAAAKQRVIVGLFSSNVHRIQGVVDAAAACGRKVVPLGFSISRVVGVALESGILKAPPGVLCDRADLDSFNRDEVVVLATGTQGEDRGVLRRAANGEHRELSFEPGDTVVMSARQIPGNERRVGKLVNDLWRQGIEVIEARDAQIHTTGHAYREEQADVLRWCQPANFLPVHGEYRHLRAHAKIAQDEGIVAQENCFVVEDGQPIDLYGSLQTELKVHLPNEVQAGNVCISGGKAGEITEIVLRDRRYLSESGFVAAVVVIDNKGMLTFDPQIISRGLFHLDANPKLLALAQSTIERALRGLKRGATDDSRVVAIRTALRKLFRQELGRQPMVVPLILNDEEEG